MLFGPWHSRSETWLFWKEKKNLIQRKVSGQRFGPFKFLLKLSCKNYPQVVGWMRWTPGVFSSSSFSLTIGHSVFLMRSIWGPGCVFGAVVLSYSMLVGGRTESREIAISWRIDRPEEKRKHRPIVGAHYESTDTPECAGRDKALQIALLGWRIAFFSRSTARGGGGGTVKKQPPSSPRFLYTKSGLKIATKRSTVQEKIFKKFILCTCSKMMSLCLFFSLESNESQLQCTLTWNVKLIGNITRK